jgi:acyl carrier protein
MSLEDEFRISIPDAMIPQIKTIKDIVEFIESAKK